MLISIKDLLKLHNNNGDDLLVWWLSEEDVQGVAWRQLQRELTRDELLSVVKGVDSGMGDSWMEVVESAVDDLGK
jgi:hypothetical protein